MLTGASSPSQPSGRMRFTILCAYTILSHMAPGCPVPTSCAEANYQICPNSVPFGCRVHVRPTTTRYGRVVPNSRLGVFLGYSRTLKILYYFDRRQAPSSKLPTHARFDEGMNDLADAPPNVQALCLLLASDGLVPGERPSLSPHEPRSDRRSVPSPRLHHAGYQVRSPDPRLCRSLLATFVSVGTCPVSPPSTSAARIRNVRRKYIGAYIVSINGASVFSCESIITALTGPSPPPTLLPSPSSSRPTATSLSALVHA